MSLTGHELRRRKAKEAANKAPKTIEAIVDDSTIAQDNSDKPKKAGRPKKGE